MKPEVKNRENSIAEALNRIAEASSLLVPVVALVLGIGMVRLLPPRLTTPLFQSQQDEEKFLQQIGFENRPGSALLLVAEGCGGACDKLRADLQQQGVAYEEYDVQSAYGKAFFQRAVAASGSEELPKVIVGASIVRPDAISVKRVIRRMSDAAP